MAVRVVLVGSGLAHLLVLERLARARRPSGLALTLIAPAARHAYSAMVPGLVGGRYRPDELLIDLPALARSAGADFQAGTMVALDPARRTVGLADGRRVAYDLLSLAVGSGAAGAHLPGAGTPVVPVKPIGRTLDLVPAVAEAAARTGPEGPRIVLAGGGAAGVELAFNLRARLRLIGRGQAPVTVIESGERVLRDRSRACRQVAETALKRHRIEVVLGSAVARTQGECVELEDGRTLGADLLVWATGSAAPALFRESGLATDAAGYVQVDATLRSTSHPEVFAAGDAASLVGEPDLPKAGVYAVRQAPVLGSSLTAAAAGRPLRLRFRPQRRFLALLNTGDGRAIFSYGDVAAIGRWAMRLKDGIDRRFMARLGIRGSPPASPPDTG